MTANMLCAGGCCGAWHKPTQEHTVLYSLGVMATGSQVLPSSQGTAWAHGLLGVTGDVPEDIFCNQSGAEASRGKDASFLKLHRML